MFFSQERSFYLTYNGFCIKLFVEEATSLSCVFANSQWFLYKTPCGAYDPEKNSEKLVFVKIPVKSGVSTSFFKRVKLFKSQLKFFI